MTGLLLNGIRVALTSATGATITLGTKIQGFNSPADAWSGAVDGTIYAWVIEANFDGNGAATDREGGFGVYTAIGGTLARNTVWSTSTGNAQISTTGICHVIIAPASTMVTSDQTTTLTAGYFFTAFDAGTQSSGTFTPNAANGNYQFYTNGGAHAIAVPAADSAMDILITNNASAGAITFSVSFSVSANTGDSLTTNNGDKFIVSIRRINAVSTYVIKALQ